MLLHSTIIHQTLLGNYPMIARWQMHRYLLRQSMAFFANEFAGRVATRVMQTSLAIREAVMKLMDILVFVAVYFVSALFIVGGADWRLMLPLILWLVVYVGLIIVFVPRLRAVSEKQADARSMMTGRVVDSYTNINTVKLFSHAGREADYARESMNDFLVTVHGQMRLVTLFHGSDLLQQLPRRVPRGGDCDLAVAGRGRDGRRDCRRDRAGAAPQRHVAVDHVGGVGPVREHRHGA